jgi:pyrroline-5-carboxylate reductase
MNFIFIGAGKMATAIAVGMCKNDEITSNMHIKAVDISAESRKKFTEKTNFECFGNIEDAGIENADVILLAVKPQNAPEVAKILKKYCGNTLIISIAAGLTLDTLSLYFNSQRIIRVMPNTPLMVSKGASAYSIGSEVSAHDEKIVRQIFEAPGILEKVNEDLMDTVTALSGSGPAYIFEMIQSMCNAAENLGLPREIALQLTVQTVAGAAEMLTQKMGTPVELRNAVTSPGGTTAAGLAVMKDEKFAELINNVIKAAHDRSIELGKK